MSEKRKENYVICSILAVLGILVIYDASQITVGGTLGQGADFLPRVIGWLLVACAAIFLAQGLLAKGEEQQKNTSTKADVETLIRFVKSLGLLGFYAMFLKQLGFVITSTIYIYAQSLLMAPLEKRSHLQSAVISVVSSVVLYLIFVYGLNLMLPAGLLSLL